MSSRAPLPDVEWEVIAPFWAAAAREEFVLPQCTDCKRYVWYPADQCTRCDAPDPVWTPVSGRGCLFSWSVVERALYAAFKDKTPYVTALVEIEEDPAVRFVTTIVDASPEDLRMGQEMRVVYRELSFTGDERRVMAPFFKPV